jgi:hypothetical protein
MAVPVTFDSSVQMPSNRSAQEASLRRVLDQCGQQASIRRQSSGVQKCVQHTDDIRVIAGKIFGLACGFSYDRKRGSN